MSGSLSRRLSVFFTAKKSRTRRTSGRSRARTLETLEPRTLLSNWYVNSSNTNVAPDGSAGNPYETIQAAINMAQPYDTILVETGNGYNESDTVGVSNLNIEADAGQSPVLDGTTPTAQSSPGFTIEAGTTGVTIEGFTIQNFTGTSAVAVQNGAELTLSGGTIQDNTNSGGDGGGINVNNGGTLTITGGTLTNNTATNGGGIYSTGNLTVSGATFTGNTATAAYFGGAVGGGGIDSSGGTAVVTGGTFTDNTAPSGGGGAIEASYGSLTASGGTFTGNSASAAGAIQDSWETMNVSDSSFASNSGTLYAGAIDNGSSNGTLTNCTFTSNTAPFAGAINNFDAGGLGGSLTLTGCTFTGNTATNGNGGTIYSSLGGNGTGVTVTNCTFSGNQTSNAGGAIFSVVDGGSGAGDTVTVSNTIFTVTSREQRQRESTTTRMVARSC